MFIKKFNRFSAVPFPTPIAWILCFSISLFSIENASLVFSSLKNGKMVAFSIKVPFLSMHAILHPVLKPGSIPNMLQLGLVPEQLGEVFAKNIDCFNISFFL